MRFGAHLLHIISQQLLLFVPFPYNAIYITVLETKKHATTKRILHQACQEARAAQQSVYLLFESNYVFTKALTFGRTQTLICSRQKWLCKYRTFWQA